MLDTAWKGVGDAVTKEQNLVISELIIAHSRLDRDSLGRVDRRSRRELHLVDSDL